MSNLISVVETYRVDTETSVASMINDAKNDGRFILAKYNCEKKEVKSKGEVIDEYYKLTFTKVFDDIREPMNDVTISYEVE